MRMNPLSDDGLGAGQSTFAAPTSLDMVQSNQVGLVVGDSGVQEEWYAGARRGRPGSLARCPLSLRSSPSLLAWPGLTPDRRPGTTRAKQRNDGNKKETSEQVS